MKFYRGSPGAARSYVESDRSRVDDYYLAEGTGLASRYVATPTTVGGTQGGTLGGTQEESLGERPGAGGVRAGGTLDGPAYEKWVAGYDVVTGGPKGRLRTDERGLRFVEVVVNGPKTWSLAATLHPEIAAAYDAAQDKAAGEIIGWLAEHATTRVGPRGRPVQVPVERLEAAVVRHYTSRAGDLPSPPPADQRPRLRRRPMARTALDRSGGLHRGDQRDRARRRDVRPRLPRSARHPRLHPGPRQQRGRPARPYAGAFSARTTQITRNIDRYEAQWRSENPGGEPGPKLRTVWDRRAWAQARPDKVAPTDGAALRRRWVQGSTTSGSLHHPTTQPTAPPTTGRPVPAPGSALRSAK